MGRQARNRLSARRIEAIKKLSKPKPKYFDGNGLFLSCKAGSFGWRFGFRFGGRSREMGLGSEADISLAKARDRAWECRQLVLDGIDPIEHRNAQKAERMKARTFKQAGEAYLAAHDEAWKHPKTRHQARAHLETYVYPALGALPVASIETAHVHRALEPIWQSKPKTAQRVRARIAEVLDWATAHGYRNGENPARWRGHFANIMPALRQPVLDHHAALPWPEAPAFLAELRAVDNVKHRALEFLILTAARTDEVLGATWGEIDMDRAVWSVPAERMKRTRPHTVPLAPRAVELLQALPRESGNAFVFIGPRGHRMGSNSLLYALKAMNAGTTVHGLRSTFRDWAGETTAFSPDVIELALAHAVGSGTERAYRRGELFDKRRKLMEAWAGYLAQAPRSGAVVSMRERA